MENALQILEKRFSDNRQAVCEYMGVIIDMKNLGYKSVNIVITIYNSIRNCLAGLSNLRYTTSHNPYYIEEV